jgi:HK97 family phage portal protein
MQIGPFEIALRKKALPALQPLSSRGNGWWPWGVIRESFSGAWQRNEEIRADTALSYYAVYSCHRLVTTDVGKLSLRLVERDDNGIWTETTSPSFSPVLRKPNRFQTINKFIEQWISSKLMYGNAYVFLERDQRRVVRAMYVLDPSRVTPLVAPDGGVYYEVKRDDLSGLSKESDILPASEIIHDTYIAPFHPLIGLSPIFACGLAATEGLSIQNNSNKFFANGANPSGMLTAPGAIGDDTVKRLLNTVAHKKPGEVLVGGDGLRYEQFTMSAVDAQLIEQLRMTAEQVCSAFGVPPYLADIGPPPPYANFEPLVLKYHSQCIQSLTTNCETSLDRGLGLSEKIEGRQLGVEFDIDDLIWMDTTTRMTAASSGLRGGMKVNEVRKRYYGLPAVEGGDVVYMQEQNHSLEALAALDKAKIRAAEQPPPQPAALPPAPDSDEDTDEDDELQAASLGAYLRKELELVA